MSDVFLNYKHFLEIASLVGWDTSNEKIKESLLNNPERVVYCPNHNNTYGCGKCSRDCNRKHKCIACGKGNSMVIMDPETGKNSFKEGKHYLCFEYRPGNTCLK